MYTRDSKLEDMDVRVVKFFFETSEGPGNITVMVNSGISIEEAGQELLNSMDGMYESIEITGHELVEVVKDEEDKPTLH